MSAPPKSSRRRYRRFVEEISQQAKGGEAAEAPRPRARPGRRGRDRDPRPKSRSAFQLLRAFLATLPGHATIVGFSLAMLTLSTLAGLVLPAAPKFAIDYVLTDQPGPAGIPDWLGLPDDRVALLALLAAAGIATSLVALLIDVTGRWQLLRASKRLATEFRRRVFRHAVRLPLWRVHALKSGGVASVLRNDAGAPSDLLISFLYSPWRSVVQLCATLVVLATVDWMLLLGALGLLPAIWLSHRTWISRIRPIYRGVRDTREDIDAHAAEAFGGMRVVRAFGQERSESVRFATSTHLMARQEILSWWWSRAVEIGWRILMPLASTFVLLYGGWRVIRGELSVGDIVLFVTYTAMLLGPLESLVSSASAIQSSLAALDRVLDLLEEAPEVGDGDAGKLRLRRDEVAGQIDLDDVWFAYPGTEKEVLRGVTLHVEAGQTVALVGPSGAGKTTLSNLVARFYDPDRGAVRLDGHDVRDLDLSSYRALLGVVEQDVFLFDGTVRDNIGYAKKGAGQDEIERAARLAHAHEFIRGLEDGYDTVIGERGVKLSGGQKQRLALARAILADPRILILDEATSNLDSESEALIQRSLEELMKGRTSFVIAHRLSTVRKADVIVVLEDGRVVEQGSHDELVARQGRYVELLRAQLMDPSATAPVGELAAPP